jgi:Carboxypeptidase regulatory-like domain
MIDFNLGRNSMSRFNRWVLAFSFLLSMTWPAFSQSRNTGEIRGTVTAAGAAVEGAVVTLSNVDTGEIKEFVTNSDGIYDTVSTPAGNYSISFTAKGFKKLVRGPIALQVDVITENAGLDVGSVTETVSVIAEGAPLLETETAHLGAILDGRTMSELPQIGAGITGNDWANYNILLPGAGSAPSQPASEGGGAFNAGDAISINGNLPNYANYLQDGGVVQLPVSNNVDNTLFEAVQEVQITTSSFSAEYGIGGAVFNQITKSGTNRFHGSAYEYFQNDMLNAAPFFGIPNGNGGFTPQKVGFIRYDQWGGSIGGPIIKNKLFFYFVRDKIYDNLATSATLGTVPTLAERGMGAANPGAYDFSALLALTDSHGNPTPIQLYDPATRSAPGALATPFAGNVIPGNRGDAVALAVLNSYPLPNAGAPGALQNNFSTILPAPNPNLRYFGRIDYDFSSKNHMSFSISQKDNPGLNKGGPFPCPQNCFSGDIDGYNTQFTDTWDIGPKLVNEFRMAYTKQGNWFVPDTIGFNNASSLGLQYAKANVYPTINVNGNGLCCSSLQPGTNAIYIEGLYDPSDVVTLIKGKHILHFGVEVLMGEGDTTPWGNITAGNFTFNGLYTAQNGAPAGTSGTGLADFLLGDVHDWAATNQITSYMRLKSPQLFIQDDYKVRPNFTLNLGLRYVGTTGMSETHNSLGGFDPTKTLVCSVDRNGVPCGAANGTLGSLWFAPQDNRNTLQKPIYDIFLPRVGFAWSIRNDTVIRGGFGMYSYNFSQDSYGNGIGFGATTTSTGGATDPNSGTGPTPLVTLSEPAASANPVLNYTVGSPSAKLVSQYLNSASPSNQTYVPYNVSPGRIQEYQLSIEHEFARNYMASIAYVGSRASNLQFPTDLNQITSQQGLVDSSNNLGFVQADRPFVAWGQLGGNNYNATTNYNALQATINKHYSSGLTYSFNYVWSHFLDEQDSSGWGSRGGTQVWQIGNDPHANYGNSNFDIPNAFKGYASYDLPFGKGRTYVTSGNRAEDALIGGWRISGTLIAQSGNPFTVTNTNNENSTITGCGNGCSWFPDVVGSTHVSNQGPNEWFNTAAFANAAEPLKVGTVSNGTVFAFGNEVRNSLRGPRLTVVNFSLGKTFKVTERVQVELRSDWANVLNHPSLNTPGNVFGAGNFGEINAATQGGGVAVGPRTGQLAARVTF